MKSRSEKEVVENIVDDNSIEITVNYDYEISESQIEECHGFHEVGNLVSITLNHVELVIAGKGIDLLPLLTRKQKEHIKSKLIIE